MAKGGILAELIEEAKNSRDEYAKYSPTWIEYDLLVFQLVAKNKELHELAKIHACADLTESRALAISSHFRELNEALSTFDEQINNINCNLGAIACALRGGWWQ